MKELGSCVAPISGEHLISESVIRVLMADGDFSVAGVPWLAEGGTKVLPPQSLRANCLCTKHNSALVQDDIEALALNILGLGFVLIVGPPDEEKYPFLRTAKFRPDRIVVAYPGKATNWLTLSWEDGKVHELLTVQFVQALNCQPG